MAGVNSTFLSRSSESHVQGISPGIGTKNTRRYLTQGTAYDQTKKHHLDMTLLMQSKLEVRVVPTKDGSCRDIPVIREEKKSGLGSGLGLCAEHLLPSITDTLRVRSGGLWFSSQQKKESAFTCLTTNNK